jgi:hypothetical protein
MSQSSSNSSGGIGFAGLLTIVFITLKLTSYINWSWWWVLSPSLISIGIVLILIAAYGGLLFWRSSIKRRKRRRQKIIDDFVKSDGSISRFTSKLHEAMERNKQKANEN